ncbi:hypothetical protein N7447_008662 [Penicillium robsamsonii]|uniref:uncharacterized protein n=1 Tax=Penicillium robsamsonii TaxID=1792511 RepID=UPI00254853D2|nr:uncharacterized protein N7447_008662 [Penicillium robsamsonii]KAJ5816429.1 hypothetical protein N7447_008662 [Penicillium robsamsonii]
MRQYCVYSTALSILTKEFKAMTAPRKIQPQLDPRLASYDGRLRRHPTSWLKAHDKARKSDSQNGRQR